MYCGVGVQYYSWSKDQSKQDVNIHEKPQNLAHSNSGRYPSQDLREHGVAAESEANVPDHHLLGMVPDMPARVATMAAAG